MDDRIDRSPLDAASTIGGMIARMPAVGAKREHAATAVASGGQHNAPLVSERGVRVKAVHPLSSRALRLVDGR